MTEEQLVSAKIARTTADTSEFTLNWVCDMIDMRARQNYINWEFDMENISPVTISKIATYLRDKGYTVEVLDAHDKVEISW